MDPLVALVDRQADFLLRQTDAQAFLIQVEAFAKALQTEPQLTAYLEDILQDLADVVGVMEEATQRCPLSSRSCGASWSSSGLRLMTRTPRRD